MGLRPFHLPISLGFVLLLCFTSSRSTGRADSPVIELKLKEQQRHQLHSVAGEVLQMRRGAPFKIAIFADLHFGEDGWTDWGPLQDANSILVMSNVLDTENPDFVVYLGDVITANNIPVANASLYWGQATSPTRDRGIPWASAFGNHDDMPFQWPIEWFSNPGIPEGH